MLSSMFGGTALPLYEYDCPECGRFEKIRKFSDRPLKTCPKGHKGIERLLSAPAIQFKGSGWYITDYARKSEPKGDGKAEGKSEPKADGTADGKAKSGDAAASGGVAGDKKAASSDSSRSSSDSSSSPTKKSTEKSAATSKRSP